MKHMMVIRQIGELLAHEMKGGVIRRFDAGDGRIRENVRVDADVATAFTARELEYVKTQTYDVKKVALKARTFIPVSTEAPSGAETVSYDQYDSFGEATYGDTYDKASPRVDAEKKNFSTKVYPARASYGFSVQDLRAIAMTGSRLNTVRAMQARRAIELRLDKVAARGDTKVGKTGFINDANVPVFGTSPTFDMTTPAKTLYNYLNAIAASVIIQSNEVERPDSIIFPTQLFQIVSGVTFGIDNETPVLVAWLRNNPYGVKNADQWTELDGAGVGGTDRIVCYRRDPAVCELEITQDYEEFPPEVRGLEFVIQCHLRTAGVTIRYPLAMVYADGTFDAADITADS